MLSPQFSVGVEPSVALNITFPSLPVSNACSESEINDISGNSFGLEMDIL